MSINLHLGLENIFTTDMLEEIRKREKELIAQRISCGKTLSASNGKIPANLAPYGYISTNGHITVNVDEAQTVEKIFDLLCEGESILEVCLDLNKNGIVNKKGTEWMHSEILTIVKNTTYYGQFAYNKTKVIYNDGKRMRVTNPEVQWIKVQVPQVITKEKFEKVQKILVGKKHNTKIEQ